jgi:hypothetical protein
MMNDSMLKGEWKTLKTKTNVRTVKLGTTFQKAVIVWSSWSIGNDKKIKVSVMNALFGCSGETDSGVDILVESRWIMSPDVTALSCHTWAPRANEQLGNDRKISSSSAPDNDMAPIPIPGRR